MLEDAAVVVPRIFLIVLALFVVWRVLTSIGRRASAAGHGADSFSRFAPRQRRRPIDERDGSGERRTEELLPCHTCGTFVPEHRAVRDADGRVFCSTDCRRLGAGAGGDAP